ncbi:helix-turn-helix transcriptional regulator [Halobaculum limi]|uniref:helix-turn-helix transcriptional regulator n=1 Tax=Halobaculum limi TaxID=3031916 RepID=UPI0024070AAB|nr:hypothetical protein [Halobaculum sp. YSMS11]
MTTGDAATLADVLAKRRDVLAAVCDGPLDKRTLVDRLDVPRTTLDRGVRELVDAGLADTVDGGVVATAVGRTVLDEHDGYRRRLAGIAAAEPLFESLPEDTPLDGRFLAGATVATPEPTVPDGVIERLFESVASARRVRGVAPVALSGHVDTFDAEATAGDAPPELVVSPDVLDHLIETRYDRVLELVEAEAMEYYYGPTSVCFGVWVAEHDDRADEAGLVVYTDTGVGGVAVNDTHEAVAWANECIDETRATATKLTAEEVRERRGLPNATPDIE